MSNVDYSHILKAVWKRFPAAHCVSFPNPLTHKWQYGIIDKDRIRNAYLSHTWIHSLLGGNPAESTSYEHVVSCSKCGCENEGDPAEFPNLRYPHCDSDTGGMPEAAAEAYEYDPRVEGFSSIVSNRLANNTAAHVPSAPDLKAQEVKDEEGEEIDRLTDRLYNALMPCGHRQRYAFTDDGGKTGHCTMCAESDLASLAKKLALALDKQTTIMERLLYVVSTHAKPTAEEAEDAAREARAVLAEAKKAGCA